MAVITHTLNLTINNSDTTYTSVIACDSFHWGGNTYYQSGHITPLR